MSFTLRNGMGANILIQVYFYVQGKNYTPGDILEMQNCRYNPCLRYTTIKLGMRYVWSMWSV